MTYNEALSAVVEGLRVRCDSMQPGCYVEHSFSRGFLRCFPVDKVEDEPSRSQCDYIAHGDETTAEWHELIRPKTDSWGKPIDVTFFAAMTAERENPTHVEVKPQRSKWGQTSEAAAKIALSQGWGKLNNPDRVDVSAFSPAEPAPKRDAWGREAG